MPIGESLLYLSSRQSYKKMQTLELCSWVTFTQRKVLQVSCEWVPWQFFADNYKMNCQLWQFNICYSFHGLYFVDVWILVCRYLIYGNVIGKCSSRQQLLKQQLLPKLQLWQDTSQDHTLLVALHQLLVSEASFLLDTAFNCIFLSCSLLYSFLLYSTYY